MQPWNHGILFKIIFEKENQVYYSTFFSFTFTHTILHYSSTCVWHWISYTTSEVNILLIPLFQNLIIILMWCKLIPSLTPSLLFYRLPSLQWRPSFFTQGIHYKVCIWQLMNNDVQGVRQRATQTTLFYHNHFTNFG